MQAGIPVAHSDFEYHINFNQMTNGVKPTQRQIEGCRHERRKKHIKDGVWVPQRFNMANVWTKKHTILFALAFLFSALVGALIP